MARLGRVHGDLMVDVVAANAKLRDRAAGVVAEIAGCDVADRAAAVDACDGNTRAAVVSVVSGVSPAQAAPWPRRIARCARPLTRWAPTRAELTTRCVLVTDRMRCLKGLDSSKWSSPIYGFVYTTHRGLRLAEPAADNGGEREAHR